MFRPALKCPRGGLLASWLPRPEEKSTRGKRSSPRTETGGLAPGASARCAAAGEFQSRSRLEKGQEVGAKQRETYRADVWKPEERFREKTKQNEE